MEFKFSIKNDLLVLNGQAKGVTGNVNSYVCSFDILTDGDLTWLCVFKQGENAYQQVIENGKCIMPKEVLEAVGEVQIGCYATNEEKRISTNWVELNISEGAYTDATLPQEPLPDVWETLVMRTLPYIGENGNWYVYDKEKGEYIDSKQPSKGEKGNTGYTPVRGADYWTDADKAEIKAYVEEAILGGEW